MIHGIRLVLASFFVGVGPSISWVAATESLAVQQPSGDPPNVVVILTDDQGWGDLSLHGNPNLSTPNLDALARGGARLTHFYVEPVCAPTRADFLTGRYHPRGGVFDVSTGGERLNADETTIADVFAAAGYRTAAFGKWHNGMQWPYHPNARGFDEFYGFCSGHWGNYFSPMLEHNGAIVQGNGYLPDDLTDRAIEYIDTHRSEPFFVYLPLNTPHSPMQVKDEDWARFETKPLVPDPRPENAKREQPEHTRAALAMCENIDTNVGRLLDALRKFGVDDDTIVVFFCDNGPNGYRFNGAMRGRKGSTFEGGVRSPLLVSFPGKIEPGTEVGRVGHAIDLLPTLTDLAGIDWTPPKPLDGISLAADLRGESVDAGERDLVSAWNGRASLRTSRYRYHDNGALYDIAEDPGETIDVAADRPDVAADLARRLAEWTEEVKPRRARRDDPRPITLAHPDAEWTQLPARDATATGEIRRSSRHPNSSHFVNWVNPNDEIVWDVEVLRPGTHEVLMYYDLPAGSEGSVVKLSLGGSSTEATIDHAHDVGEPGRRFDRFPRIEGFERDWRAMSLGRIDLQPGPGRLTLRAVRVAGDRVARVRLLMFRRIE